MDKPRETGSIGYARRRKTNPKHNTICVWHHYAQANTKNVNKTNTRFRYIWKISNYDEHVPQCSNPKINPVYEIEATS